MQRLLLGILSFLIFSVYAQDSGNIHKELYLKYKSAYKSGELDSAEYWVDKMMQASEEDTSSFFYAKSIEMRGRVEYKRLKYIDAIQSLQKAKNIYTSLDSIEDVLACNYFIGDMYRFEHDYASAALYYKNGLDIAIKLQDTAKMAKWCNSYGNMLVRAEKFEEAMGYERKSLFYSLLVNDTMQASFAYSTIGEVFYHHQKLDSALYYMSKSLELKKLINAPLSWLYSKIGKVYIEQGKYNKAIGLCEEGFNTAPKDGSAAKQFCAECLYKAYKLSGNHGQALKYHEEEIRIKSIREDLATYKEMARAAYDDLFREKKQADSVRHMADMRANEVALQLKDEQLSHENQAKNYLYIIIAVAIMSMLFILSRLNVIRKQRNLISVQKEEAEKLKIESDIQRAMVEEKNKEITDSINYAKRIQNAILPGEEDFQTRFNEVFVLYKPKDIVAGDFYWLSDTADGVLFAACDCTGHGVPGAMVSVICNNSLNRSVKELGHTDPGVILDNTRDMVVSELEKSDEEVRDGMDVAMCRLDGNKLYYAGAHNPLWILKSGKQEILEVKADKQPIGKYDDPRPYTTHVVEIEKGDCVYIFSDGFADQFGGEKGKKFKAKNFKRLLESLQTEAMSKQKSLIENAFEKWKGDYEQLDDVCVIGIRV